LTGRVLVTGSSGRLGRHVLAALAATGRDATGFDKAPPTGACRAAVGSVLDLLAVRAAVSDMDVVIHAAAAPNPRDYPPETVFDTNVRGTWNVFHAAAAAGVRRVVLISSECATGLCYQRDECPPLYLPVDEAHPLRPREPYGLSKALAEEIAASFARAGRLSAIVLRPTFILFDAQADEIPERQDLWHRDLWSYVDPRDVTRAALAALDADLQHGIFFVGAADTLSPRPTLDLVRERWGRLPELRDPELYRNNPRASLYAIAAARKTLGYVPRSDWRTLARHVGAA
jgi:UDP-glucose 4-epimerase